MRPRDWMKTCRSLGFLIPFLLGPLICLVSAARAQELPSPSKTPGVEAQAPNAEQQPQASPPAESKAEEKAEKKEEREKKEEKILHGGSIVIAPIPLVSPALGSGIVPVAGYIFPFEENKKRPEPSVIGAAGLITNNGTRAWVLGSDIYLKDARYELKAAYARGNLDYNLYGPGFVNGNAGLKLPLEQSGSFFFAEFMRRLVWDIYVGGRFINGSSLITLKPNDGNIPPIPPDIGLQTNLRALGFEVERDTRPNRFYPLRGSFIQVTADFFGKDLGSKYSFQSLQIHVQQICQFGPPAGISVQPVFLRDWRRGTVLWEVHLWHEQRAARVHRWPLSRRIYVCHTVGIPTGTSLAFGSGGVRRIRRSRSGRIEVSHGSVSSSGRNRNSVFIEQEVSRKFANRFCMGERQFHMEHGCW